MRWSKEIPSAFSSYSNFGVGLLGHVLGKLAGTDYRAALKERVLIPLGMLETSSESCDEQTAQLATANKKKNKPTKHWDFSEVTVAAGGVRSSLSDMFKFLRANIDPETSELADEIVMGARQELVNRLDSYQVEHPEVLERVVEFVLEVWVKNR